jgi:hypothetical protein
MSDQRSPSGSTQPVGLHERASRGFRRALERHPAESRFFLFLTAMGAFGLLLQKETLAEGIGYATFWCTFMVSMLIVWHDDLFTPGD